MLLLNCLILGFAQVTAAPLVSFASLNGTVIRSPRMPNTPVGSAPLNVSIPVGSAPLNASMPVGSAPHNGSMPVGLAPPNAMPLGGTASHPSGSLSALPTAEVAHLAGARPSNTIPLEFHATSDTPTQRRLAIFKQFRIHTWMRSSKVKVQMMVMFVSVMATLSVFALMWQPGAANGGNARLPPRWEPGSSTSFRAWTQDLMLWTISSDAEPHQQCALVISQLGGAAREVARTLTPAEVWQGGVVNGQQLDPVSYLLHGLSVRFGPLDDEVRLRAAQDLLNFGRRQGEGTDTLLSRFEIVRQRARAEGGGATVSTETASLILLRAVGVNHGQFQQLTQPFGFRLPSNEAEYLQMCSAIRRLGHIVESHRDNIASTLRSGGNRAGDSGHYWSNPGGEEDEGADQSFEPDGAVPQATGSYLAAEESDTASATSSDNESVIDTADLIGLSSNQAEEYLFGKYQHAKKRWRRYTGKPVRALRRVLRRKGKGKGSKGGLGQQGFLNINEVLQNSYYKGKGKGGRSSGKGFGRRVNPKGRDGEVMKCSICQSQYHLRAKCPQRPNTTSTNNTNSQSSSGPTGQIHATAQPNRNSFVHFAAFPAQAESEQPWNHVSTPRTGNQGESHHTHEQHEGVDPGNNGQERTPEVHAMSPDPLQENDPWSTWMNDMPRPSGLHDMTQTPHAPHLGPYMSVPQVPPWHVQDLRTFQEVTGVSNSRAGAMEGNSVPTLDLPPVPTGYTTQAQAMQAMVDRTVANETAGLFNEVHQYRRGRRSDRPTRPHEPAQAASTTNEPRESRRGGGGLEFYQDVCTICMSRFAPSDHCCRLQCRHVFHCLCIGEYLAHNELVEEQDIRLQCPNCREDTQVDHSWYQPNFMPQEPPATTARDPTEEAVRTPVPTDDEMSEVEEFGTPDGRPADEAQQEAFPWWPVPDLPKDEQTTEEGQSYHATVRRANGELGLLVDPGSYGNLVGSGWVEEARQAIQGLGADVSTRPRSAALRVGGVGRGAQTCNNDVMLPIAIPRVDGGVQAGTFSAPIIEGSSAPALLGLRSLTEHRAILDMCSCQLHLLGPGETRLELTPGTETFNLERAPTGHLLLPFQEYSRLGDTAQGVRHLFTEEPPATDAGYMATSTNVITTTASVITPEDTTNEAAPEQTAQADEQPPPADSSETTETTSEEVKEPTSAAPTAEEAAEGSESAEAPESEAGGDAVPADAQVAEEDEAAEAPAETGGDAEKEESEHERSRKRERGRRRKRKSRRNRTAAEADQPQPEESSARPASRHSGDGVELPLDEIANRMGLPSDRQLRQAERDEERGSTERASGVRLTPRTDDMEDIEPEEMRKRKSQPAEPARQATTRKSQSAVPAYHATTHATSSSGGARPATEVPTPKARGSVTQVTGSGGVRPAAKPEVKAMPPMPPPPRRVSTTGEEAAPVVLPAKAASAKMPPTPPVPKRRQQRPPEPDNPPTPKAKAYMALGAVLANPQATRTAKRKARRAVRDAPC